VTDALWVYLTDQRVARLDHQAGQLTLRYESGATSPLSVRLPVREEAYGDSECRPFFANLLPEGSWRDAIARQLGVAPDDDFGLLSAIGADCAGAVALRSEPDWSAERSRYIESTEIELARWVKNPAARPQLKSTPGLRLSLAGAQDKLLIHIDQGRPFLCEGGAPSTVILKPDILDPFNQVELSALNELLSMRLAAKVLDSVPRAFWFAAGFAVERFDRQRREGNRFIRLHQEDFAQVLGLPSRAKYSVNWKDCFEIATRHASTPARARVELTDRLFFNLLIGNNDAHGKNFALLYQGPDQVLLAPAYDLVSTEMYPSLSSSLAMPIGRATSASELDSSTWKSFAGEIGVRPQFLRERGNELAETVSAAVEGLLEEVEHAHPALRNDVYPARRRHELFARFRGVVETNCKRVAGSFR
jgi:serine/threonine-protein kinase HipA